MDHDGLLQFIDRGNKIWDEIRNDLSRDSLDLASFLKKAAPVVMLDNYQLDLGLARNLYRETLYLDPKKPSRKEIAHERYRQKMVAYFENSVKVLSFEIRFPYLSIDYIQEVKAHGKIRHMNCQGPETINVLLLIMILG